MSSPEIWTGSAVCRRAGIAGRVLMFDGQAEEVIEGEVISRQGRQPGWEGSKKKAIMYSQDDEDEEREKLCSFQTPV